MAFKDDRNGDLSYGDFEELTGKVYQYLCSKNIGKEDFVLICVERGYIPLIISIGVLKAGAAFIVVEKTASQTRYFQCLVSSGRIPIPIILGES